MTEIQSKRLYIIHPRIDAFSFGIIAICLCYSVNIKLENSIVKKRSLFPALADLYKFLENCSLSAALSIQNLFRIKLLSISTKIVPRQGS